jgi:phosphoglycolate phosphatase
MTRLIIFDFDGTLGDTRANIVLTLQQTLETLGYPPVDEGAIIATIGLPLEESFARLIPGLSEEEKERCARTYREIFEKNRKILIPKLFPHVYKTLGSLHAQGITMSVASSRRAISLNAFLQEMGIAPFFSFVLGADNVSKAKPDPEPVLHTLREMGFTPEETLVVGDMPVDILMGRRAGTRTCAVTYGNASREALAEAGADYILDGFDRLMDLFPEESAVR